MKRIILSFAFLLLTLISCRNDNPKAGSLQTESDSGTETQIVEPSGNHCYRSTANNSQIEISFNVNSHQEVNGTLSYNLSGKDKNEGRINGEMAGDTLIADYMFDSEGVTSVRQVVFLLQEGTLIEGYGDVVQANDRIYFKNRKSLKFDSRNTLQKVECNN